MQALEFDGKARNSIFILLAAVLIVTFTFGIATPWATTLRQRWIAKHTILNGKRMKFKGEGSSLFGKWIVWWLLSFVTFGIYALFVWARYQKWIVENTVIEE